MAKLPLDADKDRELGGGTGARGSSDGKKLRKAPICRPEK